VPSNSLQLPNLPYLSLLPVQNDTAPTNATLSAIQMLKSRARVSILCFDDIRELRKFALGLFDAGMATKVG